MSVTTAGAAGGRAAWGRGGGGVIDNTAAPRGPFPNTMVNIFNVQHFGRTDPKAKQDSVFDCRSPGLDFATAAA